MSLSTLPMSMSFVHYFFSTNCRMNVALSRDSKGLRISRYYSQIIIIRFKRTSFKPLLPWNTFVPRELYLQNCVDYNSDNYSMFGIKYYPRDTKISEDKWYNNQKNASIWRNPALLSELLLNWIIWRYYESKPYNLLQPDVEDPSMGQARKIRDIFNDKKGGFFIECGAYDGETRSNTLVLERLLGWNGLLIEADPINFTKMLQKNRKAFLSPTCLSVHTYPVIASFLMARNIGRLHDTTNSTENTPKNTADVAHSGDHVNVQCFPLASYIAALDVKTVDYFSLDIEGNEIDVLETIPFDQVDIKTLSVEHIHNSKGRQYLIDLMDKRGYYVHSLVERADNLANDVIFVKREA